MCVLLCVFVVFFFQAEDGIRDLVRSRGLGDVYKRQKGTNGYGEEIFRDGRLVAMSDWELARIGDPAYDWAQIQGFVCDVVVNLSLIHI